MTSRVVVGDEVVVRRDGGGFATGLVVDGELIEAQPDYDDTAGLIVMAVFFSLFVVITAPMMVWSWQTFRQIRADLGAPLTEETGVYLGSWQWRGLTNRLGRGGPAGALAHHLSGVPVAVSIGDDLRWYAAPAVAVPALVDFESAIKAGDRRVTVSLIPRRGQSHASKAPMPQSTSSRRSMR